MAEKDDSRELVLAPNEQAFILDKTSGNIYLYAGPKQDSLTPSSQPVIFNEHTKMFDRCDLSRAVQKVTVVPEGWYVVLKNPTKKGDFPQQGSRTIMPELDAGRKVIIPGPANFALWPGQMVRLLRGHTLRSNQYLIVRVYDQASAKSNWKNATIETTDPKATTAQIRPETLTMGQLIVIRGTDVSFFVPPNGVEVVHNEEGKYERDAVSLERLEYCILLDENGNKRYEQGPKVVFPEPTEVFYSVEDDGDQIRKFRAIELSETSGIYVKVTADYEDETGKYEEGEELFITGDPKRSKNGIGTKIYFPRPEQVPIKYGDHEVHYSTAIPLGEGRYVLDRLKGTVDLVEGPTMLLPDPRTHVIVNRILDDKQCSLLYPGNHEALAHNRGLRQKVDDGAYYGPAGVAAPVAAAMGGAYAMPGTFSTNMADSALESAVSNAATGRGLGGRTASGFRGDSLDRKGRYTEPRTVTLNTKFSGAVAAGPYLNYAMKLVRKDGNSRVVIGPKTVLLEYDETVHAMHLSTGNPKNTDKLSETAYLIIKANKVSDTIMVESADLVKMSVKVSYRVNFEGEPEKWFEVDNYVKFLCDHMRSRLQSVVKRLTVDGFHQQAIGTVRDTVLGEKRGDEKRTGTRFEENGMHVYDVEVLDVKILDPQVEQTLITSQRKAIDERLSLEAAQRNLSFVTKSEDIKRKVSAEQATTILDGLTLAQQKITKQLEHDIAKITSDASSQAEAHKAAVARETGANQTAALMRARAQADEEQQLAMDQQRVDLRLKEVAAQVEATFKQSQAFTPQLIAAMQAFGDKAVMAELSKSMSPLAIIGGESLTDVIKRLLSGTPIADRLGLTSNGNGSSKVLPSAASSQA